MRELIKIGVHLEQMPFDISLDSARVAQYQTQIHNAAMDSWGAYWPTRIHNAAEQSGIYPHIATVVTRASQILKVQEYPQLGLLNGLDFGMIKNIGYCWSDDAGKTWVGLDESWFNDIVESIADSQGFVQPLTQEQITFALAEEVCHAYIREVRPDIAEASQDANASGDIQKYHNDPGERMAKEFARWYTAH